MLATIILAVILIVMIAAFVRFFAYSRTESWWQSGTRKALLAAVIAAAPFLGGHFRKKHVEIPTVSTPFEPDDSRPE